LIGCRAPQGSGLEIVTGAHEVRVTVAFRRSMPVRAAETGPVAWIKTAVGEFDVGLTQED
jgi:hypothetical protein